MDSAEVCFISNNNHKTLVRNIYFKSIGNDYFYFYKDAKLQTISKKIDQTVSMIKNKFTGKASCNYRILINFLFI